MEVTGLGVSLNIFEKLAEIACEDDLTKKEKETGLGDLTDETLFDIENFDLLEMASCNITQENYFLLASMIEDEKLAEELKKLDMFDDLQEKVKAYQRQGFGE
jgi:hypothetical protein